MPDTKITALTAIGANPINVATFPIPMVDLTDTSMAASGTTKKVTVNQILGAGGTATLASATITGDLTVDTSTLKVDSANNRVGIGTASPAYPLDVNGAIQTTSGSAAGLFQWAYGASASSRSWRAWNDVSANGDFQISTSTTRTGSTYSDRYRIDVSGVHEWSNTSGLAMTLNATGLGVGASPLYKLHAVVTSGAVGAFRASTAAIARLLVGNTVEDVELKVNANGDGQLTANASKYLGLGSGGINDRVILDTAGNVGIGVSTFGTSAAKVLGLANATAPSTSPAGMGQLYVEAGALKYRGSSGTVTTIAAA